MQVTAQQQQEGRSSSSRRYSTSLSCQQTHVLQALSAPRRCNRSRCCIWGRHMPKALFPLPHLSVWAGHATRRPACICSPGLRRVLHLLSPARCCGREAFVGGEVGGDRLSYSSRGGGPGHQRAGLDLLIPSAARGCSWFQALCSDSPKCAVLTCTLCCATWHALRSSQPARAICRFAAWRWLPAT